MAGLEAGLGGSVPKLVLLCCSWCWSAHAEVARDCSRLYKVTGWDRRSGNCLRKRRVKGNSCLSVLFQQPGSWRLAFSAEFIRMKPFCASGKCGLVHLWLIFSLKLEKRYGS